MRYVAVVAAVMTVTLALAQEQLVTISQSWEDWRPPVVEMPEPNAYDQYQIAFDMLEGFEAPEQDATDEELRASIQGFEPAYQALQQAQEGECRFPPLMAPGQGTGTGNACHGLPAPVHQTFGIPAATRPSRYTRYTPSAPRKAPII